MRFKRETVVPAYTVATWVSWTNFPLGSSYFHHHWSRSDIVVELISVHIDFYCKRRLQEGVKKLNFLFYYATPAKLFPRFLCWSFAHFLFTSEALHTYKPDLNIARLNLVLSNEVMGKQVGRTPKTRSMIYSFILFSFFVTISQRYFFSKLFSDDEFFLD